MKTAATNGRTFRTFLLVAQLESEKIGARIRQARDEAGMTQEQLADVARGFSKRSLQDYETGVTIPYKHMQEIAAITGKEPEWILHGDPEPPATADEATVEKLALRLEALEATVAESIALSREMLQLLRETAPPVVAAPPVRKRANG